MMALNEITQLEREIESSENSFKTYYKKLIAHPMDVREYNYDHRYGYKTAFKYISSL